MYKHVENGVYLSSAGPLISFCPILACVLHPSPDHQRATALFVSTSKDDSHSEEQNLALETIVKTGFQKPWSPRTQYNKGDNVVRPNQNAIYRALSSGVSGVDNDGPHGKGRDIIDGSVHWEWINDAAIGAKAGLYNELVALPGAGAVWGQANNVNLSPGVTPVFAANTEFDFGNHAKDCILGQQQCYNLFLETSGLTSTASIYATTTNTDGPAAYFGVLLAGEKLARDVDVEDDASATIGIGICADGITKCFHAEGDIVDRAQGPSAMKIEGNHTVGTMVDESSSPTFALIGGRKAVASIYDRSTSPVGLDLGGSYKDAQIRGSGWSVRPDGYVLAHGFQAPLSEPSSSKSRCTTGEFMNSRNFYYVCTSANHWKRAPLSDF